MLFRAFGVQVIVLALMRDREIYTNRSIQSLIKNIALPIPVLLSWGHSIFVYNYVLSR